MYIENKQSWDFLAKKSFWKKFLIKIDKDWINENLLARLTKKECDFIFKSENYKNFLAEIYNENTLKEVIFKSKFLSNNIEVLDILQLRNLWIENKKLHNNLNPEEILYKQWSFFRGWIKDTFPIKFIYNSNNIEWSRIPQEEVEKIIENKKYIYKVKNEIQEVKNSKKAWDFLEEKFIFNDINIKKVYHILTKELLQKTGLPYPRWYKKVVNVAWNNRTTEPENVASEMLTLIDYYKKNKKNISPLQLAFDFHLKYEQIHPFENGNWRTWRLFMNKILMQNWMIPMIVFKENSKSYSNSIWSCSDWKKKKYYKFMIEQYKKTIDNSYEFTLWLLEWYNKSFIKMKDYLDK